MLITERYKEQITGVLSCYDRIVIQGTLPGWCYDQGMTAFLYSQGIRIFDYPGFAQGLRVFSAVEACTGCVHAHWRHEQCQRKKPYHG